MAGLATPKPPVYKKQNSNAADNVAAVIRKGGPLMKLAETEGYKQANRRGLLSSSIAVGAAQNEVYKAATPIGLQEAAQRATSNLQGRELSATERMQLRDLEVRERMQGKELSAADRLQLRDLQSRERMQGKDLSSSERMQLRDLQSRASLQQGDNAFRSKEALLDRQHQRVLAGMNLDAADKERVAGVLANYQNTYENQIAQINANQNLKAADRTAQIKDLQARRTNYLAVISDIYGVDVSWPVGRAPGKPTPGVTPGVKPVAKPKPPTPTKQLKFNTDTQRWE